MLSPLPRRSDWAYCFAHFTQPCQPSPIWQSGRPAHCPFRGLLGVHSRYGLHTRAVTVFRDTLSEGFSHFVTSMTAPVASGWSVRRVGFAPTGKRRLVTAHTSSGHCIVAMDVTVLEGRRRSRSKFSCPASDYNAERNNHARLNKNDIGLHWRFDRFSRGRISCQSVDRRSVSAAALLSRRVSRPASCRSLVRSSFAHAPPTS